jgi:hypothetical protein
LTQAVSFLRSPWAILAIVGRSYYPSLPVDSPYPVAACLATADRSSARRSLGSDQSFLIHPAHSYFRFGFRLTFNSPADEATYRRQWTVSLWHALGDPISASSAVGAMRIWLILQSSIGRELLNIKMCYESTT